MLFTAAVDAVVVPHHACRTGLLTLTSPLADRLHWRPWISTKDWCIWQVGLHSGIKQWSPLLISAPVEHCMLSNDRLTFAAALSPGPAYCTVVCDCTRPRQIGRALSSLFSFTSAQPCWPRLEVTSPGAQGVLAHAALPAWLEAVSPAPQLCRIASTILCVSATPRFEGSSPGARLLPAFHHLSGLGVLLEVRSSLAPAQRLSTDPQSVPQSTCRLSDPSCPLWHLLHAILAACALKPLQLLCLACCLLLPLCAAHVTTKPIRRWHRAPQGCLHFFQR